MSKINEKQKTTLTLFMEENEKLGKGQFDKFFNKEKANMLWAQITETLNSQGGAVKDVKKWKKTWSDLKVDAKRRASALKCSLEKTGGGSPSDTEGKLGSLSTIDERILSLIGNTVVHGISGVAEVGISESKTPLVDYDVNHESSSDENTDYTPAPPLKIPKLASSSITGRVQTKKLQADKWLKNGEEKAKALMLQAQNLGRIADSLEVLASNVGRVAASLEAYNEFPNVEL